MIDLKAHVGHGKAGAILDEADEAFAYFRSMVEEVAGFVASMVCLLEGNSLERPFIAACG